MGSRSLQKVKYGRRSRQARNRNQRDTLRYFKGCGSSSDTCPPLAERYRAMEGLLQRSRIGPGRKARLIIREERRWPSFNSDAGF
jgi:hypothetical protein